MSFPLNFSQHCESPTASMIQALHDAGFIVTVQIDKNDAFNVLDLIAADEFVVGAYEASMLRFEHSKRPSFAVVFPNGNIMHDRELNYIRLPAFERLMKVARSDE